MSLERSVRRQNCRAEAKRGRHGCTRNGRGRYYYNTATGTSQWDPPRESRFVGPAPAAKTVLWCIGIQCVLYNVLHTVQIKPFKAVT